MNSINHLHSPHTTPRVSVVICTHNSQKDYLARVLKALRDQTLPYEQWELLVIDNCSEPPLADRVDLAWHPRGVCIREDELGLTAARLRGIKSSKEDLIVFVDDDNVLDHNYLAQTIDISSQWPRLGAWGGRIIPEFDSPPPEWTRSYWDWLGNRSFSSDVWACMPQPNETVPYGAGMTIRRRVADLYVEKQEAAKTSLRLDRAGDDLLSCGDIDMAMTSWDLGLGTGLFTSLRLTHLIPDRRLTAEYLLRITEGNAYASTLHSAQRGLSIPQLNIYNTVYHFLRGLRRNGFERSAYYARQRGISRAIRDLQNHRH